MAIDLMRIDLVTPSHFHTIPTSCAISPLTQICFACFLVVSRGLWKAVRWVVLGVHVDVHGERVMLWVAAVYNVLGYTEHDRCSGLSWPVCRNGGVHA